jgi:hypothetical protein
MIFKHIRIFDWNASGLHMDTSCFGGTTIAVEEFKPWVLPTLNPGDFFEKKIGVAVCHKEDRFNKKTGRELAQGRAKLEKLTVHKVVKELDKVTVDMQDSSGNEYVFVKYTNANSVFFMDFNFKDSFEY